MPFLQVEMVASLSIGKHAESRIPAFNETDSERDNFAAALAVHTEPLSKSNTMDCMDDRPTLEMGDGTSDPEILRARVVPQWAGGMVLATTKAAVAADVAYLRGIKSFTSAYMLTAGLLKKLGYEDGGHAKCGAAGLVEASSAEPVIKDLALPLLPSVIEVADVFDVSEEFQKMYDRKRQLADSGFFKDWSGDWHEHYLLETVPHNFSRLKTVDDNVHGHHGKGVYIIGDDNSGFAKNAFYKDTGQMAFCLSSATPMEIAQKIGASPKERARVALGFGTDALDVSDKLLDLGAEAFKQAA